MFKKIIFGIIITLTSVSLFLSPVLHAAPLPTSATSISSVEREMIRQVVETMTKLHQDQSDAVWPGYDLYTVPLILTFNNGHIYAFHLKSSNSAWQKLSIENMDVLYSDQDKWGLEGIHMHPQFDIDNQKAFVFHFDMLQADPFQPFLVLVHERFHHHQFEHFTMDDSALDEGYHDHQNADNLALMQLEELILVDFLKIQGSSSNDQQRKLDILKDFVAVHQARVKLLQPSSLRWEQIQQTMEGLADYVSMKTFEVYPILPGFYSQIHLLHLMQGYASDDNISDRAIKWRHYGVGATLGFALDFLKVSGWKYQVEKKDVPLDTLLSKAIKLSDAETSKRIVNAKQRYHYTTFRNTIGNELKAYMDEINGHMKKFKSMDGVEITLQKPKDVSISGGGRNSHMYYLADGSTLSLDESSENRTNDNLWSVSFHDEPFIFLAGDSEREFKLESNLDITLDGKTYRLKDLMSTKAEKSFSTISWEGKRCAFESQEHTGKLSVNDGKVIVSFEG